MAVKDKNTPANQGDDFIQAIERRRATINEEGLVVKAWARVLFQISFASNIQQFIQWEVLKAKVD